MRLFISVRKRQVLACPVAYSSAAAVPSSTDG